MGVWWAASRRKQHLSLKNLLRRQQTDTPSTTMSEEKLGKLRGKLKELESKEQEGDERTEELESSLKDMKRNRQAPREGGEERSHRDHAGGTDRRIRQAAGGAVRAGRSCWRTGGPQRGKGDVPRGTTEGDGEDCRHGTYHGGDGQPCGRSQLRSLEEVR